MLLAALVLAASSPGAVRADERADPASKTPSKTQASWSDDADGAVADEARAKHFFDLGKQAIASGRFAEARQNFEASLVRVPRVAAAFNLAIAYRGIGMPVETAETLARIERGIYGPVREDRRVEIRRLADEARRDIAYVDLRVTGAGASAVLVRVDSQDAGTIEPSSALVLAVNPGSRGIHLQCDGYRAIDKQVSPKPGEKLAIAFLLVPVPKVEPTHVAQRSSVFASPWFWLGAGVVVAGAAVTTVAVVSSSGTRDPVNDPTFGVTPTSSRFR